MYIRGFDGLRAFAVLLVFITHKTDWGASNELGFSGVWLFFLLSGFLITGQLQAARSRIEAGRASVRGELVSFWIKRAMRILPAYYLVILVVAPFYLMTRRDVPGLPFYLGYLSNFYFQQHPSEFLTTWAHFWSLAVEEQYYILFAPVILFLPFRLGSLACIVVILVSLFQRTGLALIGVKPYVVYIDSLVNFGLISLGGLLYVHRATVMKAARSLGSAYGCIGWIAIAGVAAISPFAHAVAGPNVILLQLLYVGGTFFPALLLMNVYTNQASQLVRVLELRPIAYLGRISYGLYLYNDYVKADMPHWVLRSASERIWSPGHIPDWIDQLLREGTPGALLMRGAGLVICFLALVIIAHLSWTGMEKRALRLRDWILRRLFAAEPKRAQADMSA